MASQGGSNKRKPNSKAPDALTLLKAETNHAIALTKQSWSIYHFNLREKWITLMMKAVDAAWKLKDRNPNRDIFHVFTLLGHRLISHHQAIRHLTLMGRYGEAYAICRMLLELADLFPYFVAYPGDVQRWREAFSKDPSNLDQDARNDINYFSAPNVRKRLGEAGIDSIPRELHSHLNAAVHASEWGTMYYGHSSLENPGVTHLQFDVALDPSMAFGIGQLANLTLSRPIWSFIEYCEVNKAAKSSWRTIKANYEDMLPDWELLVNDVDAKFANLMGDVARMRMAGASVDEIEAFMNSTLETEA